MKYRLKPKIKDIYSCVFNDKEITVVEGNKLKKEINKELETWLTYGYIKKDYKSRYPQKLIIIIESIINKYHKKYKGLWEQAQILEKKYAETDLEEMEEAYEMTMNQVQIEKNKLYEEIILPEINKLLKENEYI